MDFKDLLQLAKGNTTISQKKVERQFGDPKVSSTAVERFLTKKKREAGLQKAKEDEARKKRIMARLESSSGKRKPTKPVSQQQEKPIENTKQRPEQKTKLRAEENVKKKERSSKSVENLSSKTSKNHLERKESKHKHDKTEKQHSNSSNNKEPSHRKTDERIEPNKKKPAKKVPNSSLSFAQLAAMAKTNSSTASADKLNPLKRAKVDAPPPAFDPDRDVPLKIARKEKHAKAVKSQDMVKTKHKLETRGNSKHSSNTLVKNRQNNDIDKSSNQHKPREKDKKYISSTSDKMPVKRGLISETISDKKVNRKDIAPRLTSNPKQVMPGRQMPPVKQVHKQREEPARGIAAQCKSMKASGGKMRSKKSTTDYEDEFDREERELARKRKLFEMRRVTGDRNLAEEDLYGDYDLDEEDSDDNSFIDDTGDNPNVSKYISSIFGYDRHRYVDSDEDDLKDMEASYSQIQKEEARSARIAKIEDEYEAMKEQEELQRKAAKKQ